MTEAHLGRMPALPTRAIDVVWFNYPTYAASIVAVIFGLTAAMSPIPKLVRVVSACGALLAGWWLMASTLVAAWVFQLSGVTRWRWLPGCFDRPPSRWLNVTTGFDDTSSELHRLLGGTGTSLDVFDPATRHDGSILRARRSQLPTGQTRRPGKRLPFESASHDAVFLLMAAHELRDEGVRRQLLRETARLLAPGGKVVVVEHLRNATNAVAFGPGVLHFYGRRAWIDQAAAAGLRLEIERPLTPFATAFVFGGEAA